MKTKFIVMAAMAAMFSMGFTACSNNDDEMGGQIAQTRGDAIGFVPSAGFSHVTRGDATNSGNVTSQIASFQAWAYDATTNGIYMGAAATGVTVTYQSSADATLGNWVYAPVQFWPVNELNFLAVTPVAAPTGGALSHSTSAATGTATILTNYTAPTAVEDQVDLMYACGHDATMDGETPAYVNGPVAKDDFAGDVPLQFKHALSQVVFQGKLTTDAVTKVVIEEITLGNIAKSVEGMSFTSAGSFFGGADPAYANGTLGTANVKFSLAGTQLEGKTWGLDETKDGITAAQKVTKNSAFDLTVSNSANDLHNAWFMIPQNQTAWAGTGAQLKAGGLYSGSANVDPASGSYLKIRAALYKDGVQILGSNESDAIYIPLAAQWERGKKYIYTIEFNGTAALTPITFSVAAENWTDAAQDPISM